MPASNLRIEVITPKKDRYWVNTQETPEMSENVPFLGAGARSPYSSPKASRTSFASPLNSPSARTSAGNPFSSHNDFSPPNSPLVSAMAIPAAVTRRSRPRLILLCLLAVIGFATFIASMNAPEHVKAKVYETVSKAGDSVKGSWEKIHPDDIWQGAKEWSGWGNKDAEGQSVDEIALAAPVAQTEQEAASAENGKPESVGKPVEGAPKPATPNPKETSSSDSEKVVHPIYVLPDPPRMPSGDSTEQFFSYLPHSGFHNQRIELANALTLATMLNRTLLLPPVWIGWPATTHPYQLMQENWDTEMRQHPTAFKARDPTAHEKRQRPPVITPSVEECKSYAKECRFTYHDTFVAWSFLTDMTLVETKVPVVDRFNMSEAYAKELTGATGPDDVYLLEDFEKYYFGFDDTAIDGETIQKYQPDESKYLYRVSVPRLREDTANHKLLMMGSIFGSGRLHLKQGINRSNLAFFHRALAFRNPILETPANIIRDQMGGSTGYAGIHARVGDGSFLLDAPVNMDVTFTQLMGKLGVDKELVPELLAKGAARAAELNATAIAAEAAKSASASATEPARLIRRAPEAEEESEWTMLDDKANDGRSTLTLPKRDHLKIAKRQQLNALRPIKNREDSPLADTLKCRGELYTDPRLLMLNNPVYLATDSPHPLTDPVLSNYWANLPCTFILADFDRLGPQNTGDPVTSLRYMEGVINMNDGVKLGRLLLPFMEAAVAAKAAVTVGTRGSTFSGFAAGFLHDAYADDAA